MNVNPFSYLIEKLKGKVDRYNDWAYNTDLNTLKSDGLYHLGTGQTNVPSGIDANWSTLYVNGNGVETASQTFISRNNVVYTRVCISGTWGSWNELALKSDIPTVKSVTVTLDTNNYNRVADTGLLVSKCVPLCAEVAGYQCVIGSSYNDHWYASIIEYTSGSTVTLSISATIYYLEK